MGHFVYSNCHEALFVLDVFDMEGSCCQSLCVRFLCARQVRRHGVAAWGVVREALPVISRTFWPGVSCGSVAPNQTRIQSFFADDGVTETCGWFEARDLSLNVSCA